MCNCWIAKQNILVLLIRWIQQNDERWYCLWKNAIETVTIFGLCKPSQWHYLDGSKSETLRLFLWSLGPWSLLINVVCPGRLRFLFVSFENDCTNTLILLWNYKEKKRRKNILLDFDCDPRIEFLFWCFLPHPPFSCCSLSVVSRLRAGSHLRGWASWMEWDGRKQRPSCYDIFLCSLCMTLELVKKLPKEIAWFDLNWKLSQVLFFCFFFID